MSRRSKTARLLPIDDVGGAIGATIVTPGYEALAFEAVKHFKAATGLDTVMLFSDSMGYFKKLDLPELLAPKTIIFYDSDLLMVRSWDAGAFLGTPYFWGVPDPSAHRPECFPGADCISEGLDPDAYINTGLMIWNNALPSHREVFTKAREEYNASLALPAVRLVDVTEQGWLNLALLSAPRRFLPLAFNYFFWLEKSEIAPPPCPIIGLHAAGYPLSEKLEHLHSTLRTLRNV